MDINKIINDGIFSFILNPVIAGVKTTIIFNYCDELRVDVRIFHKDIIMSVKPYEVLNEELEEGIREVIRGFVESLNVYRLSSSLWF